MIRAEATWLAVALAGTTTCTGAGDVPPPAAPTDIVAPVPSQAGAFSPSGDKHPGQIVYEDHVEHRTWTKNAFEVPATIAWVRVRDHWIPVVWIEINGAGRQREITTYGPNHEFLEHTTAHLPAPAPAPSDPTPAPTAPVATPTPQ